MLIDGSTHLNNDKTYLIPILGSITADMPISEQPDILGYEEMNVSWKKQGEFIALKIKGDSMLPELKDDDTVIIKLQPTIENGKIGVAQVSSNEYTIKKIIFNNDGVTLMPLNIQGGYNPLFFHNNKNEELPIKPIGILAEIRRRFL
ncbi:hypothetical protein AZF37_00620 [endosymbiont 'TC1' of Trimyema compressum]|uniref:LexA family protein n=1 Tax=endosymbiont 'TC1' of Trimyema compressum TaxID=243899 RepID=UPI0007F11F5A|nr:S24 family peptidase [endosymbiont 'TC1' of Trimyema compressum]AMP19876.1 hypothetical protein AZF37_00620 [endosymbiont 'TC1' of Trimyema compressum]